MSALIAFDLHLDEACIFSANPATAGDHRTHDFIPGSAVRGWVASQLYRGMTSDGAWEIFHSGNVLFSDGFPLSADGAAGLPEALSLHRLKGDDAGGPLYNLSRYEQTQLQSQPVQSRKGYRTVAGHHFTIKTERSLRTAIEPGRSTALASGLFGYEAISPGRAFRIFVRLSDRAGRHRDNIVGCLAGASVHLGRSKSVEYGKITCTPVSEAECGAQAAGCGPVGPGLVSVWLCSDLDADDRHSGCAVPDGGVFGLQNAAFRPDKSFLRTSDSVRYNAAIGAYEGEKRLIGRGSVVTYDLPETMVPTSERIGSFRLAGQGSEVGRGLFLLDPELLNRETIEAPAKPVEELKEEAGETPAMPGEAKRPEATHTDLTSYLARISGRTNDEARDIEALRETIEAAYAQARQIFPPVSGVAPGPTTSQWSKLIGLAKASTNYKDLHERLVKATSDPETELIVPRWAAEFLVDGKLETFQKFLRTETAKRKDWPFTKLTHFMANLARAGADLARGAAAASPETASDD